MCFKGLQLRQHFKRVTTSLTVLNWAASDMFSVSVCFSLSFCLPLLTFNCINSHVAHAKPVLHVIVYITWYILGIYSFQANTCGSASLRSEAVSTVSEGRTPSGQSPLFTSQTGGLPSGTGAGLFDQNNYECVGIPFSHYKTDRRTHKHADSLPDFHRG